LAEAKDIPEYPLATLLGGEEGHEIRHVGDFQSLTYSSGGERKYHENQDSVYANADVGAIAVVDGMGGHGGGKAASMAATTAISDGIIDNISTDEIIGNAKTRIQKLEEPNPGVTLAIVRTKESGGKYYLECTNVGDSQIILVHPQKGLIHVSKDQSGVQSLYDRGMLTDPLDRYTHQYNNIVVNAVMKAANTGAPARTRLEVEKGTYAFALTDGITDFVSPEEIVDIVQTYERAAPVKIKELAESRQWKIRGFQIKLNGQIRHANSPTSNHGDNIGIAMMIVGGENPAKSVPESIGKNDNSGKYHPAFSVAPQRAAQERVAQVLGQIIHPQSERITPHFLQANRENIYEGRRIIGVQFGIDQNLHISLSNVQGQLQIDCRPIGGQMITLNTGEEMILGRDQLGGDSKISRKHVKIKYLQNGEVSITDLGSSNGTQVF